MKVSEPDHLQEKIERLQEEVRFLNSKVSSQSKLEEQLQRAQKTKALASLAGGIAHDFNNILQAILGYTQLALMHKDRQEPDYQTFCEIEAIVKKGGELTEQFLRIGRKMRPKNVPLNLNNSIAETKKLLRRTIPKMIDIDLKLADNLMLIDADKGQIEQILMNLSINARDAMPGKGKLTLTTKNILDNQEISKKHQSDPSGKYICLSVADTGCGMSSEMLQRIFEPFYTQKKDGNGNGLGLSMVNAIVKNHGGFIDCSSRLGKGTVFRIYFPAVKRAPVVAEPSQEETRTNSRGQETILMVDDETDILNIGKEVLEKFGYKVITAHNGEEAVQKYTHHRVDSVILDVGMPGMGGINCLKKLMSIDRQVKVLIISGYGESDGIEEALSLGAKAFLNKPYRINNLLETVRIVLDEKDLCLRAVMD